MITRLKSLEQQRVSEPVSVHILDREYTVGVEAGERDSLMAAANLLDAKMREVRGSNQMAAVDRVAVLAALNLAHELQQLRDDAARATGNCRARSANCIASSTACSTHRAEAVPGSPPQRGSMATRHIACSLQN